MARDCLASDKIQINMVFFVGRRLESMLAVTMDRAGA
jgi:hypothetical protein